MAKDMIISLKGGGQAGHTPQMTPERHESHHDYAPPMPHTPRRGRQQLQWYKRIAYGMGTLIIILGAWFAYRAWNPPAPISALDPNATPAEQQQAAQLEITTLIERIGKLIVLPTGEEPTVATVSDPDKLKDQAFFANARVGDKVLIYTKARKAYLYDPEGDILLEVAPITAEGL